MSDQICNHMQEMLPDYLDGKLSEAEQGELRDHLASCQGCVNMEQQLRPLMTQHLASKRKREDSPVDWAQFRLDVNERIDQSIAKKGAPLWHFPNVLYPVAAALLIIFGLWILPTGIFRTSGDDVLAQSDLFSEDEQAEIRAFNASPLLLDSLTTVLPDEELSDYAQTASVASSIEEATLLEEIDATLIEMFGTEDFVSASLDYLDAEDVFAALTDEDAELLASALETHAISLD